MVWGAVNNLTNELPLPESFCQMERWSVEDQGPPKTAGRHILPSGHPLCTPAQRVLWGKSPFGWNLPMHYTCTYALESDSEQTKPWDGWPIFTEPRFYDISRNNVCKGTPSVYLIKCMQYVSCTHNYSEPPRILKWIWLLAILAQVFEELLFKNFIFLNAVTVHIGFHPAIGSILFLVFSQWL